MDFFKKKIKLQYILFKVQNVAVFELLNMIILSSIKVLLFSFELKYGGLHSVVAMEIVNT
jgi:hypothetical protein